MNSNRKTTLFSIFAFGLIAVCFLLLLQEVVLAEQRWEEIPKVFAGLMVPLPIALFFGFVFANRESDAAVEPNPRVMTSLLLITIFFIIGVGMVAGPDRGEAIGMGPVITQAAVFSSSLLNVFGTKNPTLASVLSGISIGLTIFVIFLT